MILKHTLVASSFISMQALFANSVICAMICDIRPILLLFVSVLWSSIVPAPFKLIQIFAMFAKIPLKVFIFIIHFKVHLISKNERGFIYYACNSLMNCECTSCLYVYCFCYVSSEAYDLKSSEQMSFCVNFLFSW